ncbi:MAG TPA: pseudouridine synthase [Candidatus Saccharimonadales bacterium]|nr:pseudouridine synthase [Candidatus Saccharimonadales bacterium]
MRLNKFLAQAGIASRRHAEEIITKKQVRINGQVVTNLATQVDPENDQVLVSGRPVSLKDEKVIYLLNKPRGVVTTAEDPEGRPTVLEYVPKTPRVFPCGRLDAETMGLIILTNDGSLCYQLTHPKFEHQKEYRVFGNSKSPELSWERLQHKIVLKDGPVTIDKLDLRKIIHDKIDFNITIHEGRNHLVRRICTAVGIEVEKLTRIRFGQYELGEIEPGKYQQVQS